MFIPENQNVSFSTYRNAVAEASHVSNDILEAMRGRIQFAFDAGEPIWMLAEEMKLRGHMSSLHDEKAPIQLATKVTRL